PIDALVERILGIPSVATQTVLLACVVVGFLLTRKSRHYSSFDRIINAAAMVVLLTIVAAMAISLLSHNLGASSSPAQRIALRFAERASLLPRPLRALAVEGVARCDVRGGWSVGRVMVGL